MKNKYENKIEKNRKIVLWKVFRTNWQYWQKKYQINFWEINLVIKVAIIFYTDVSLF